jgi:hypothetical protein
MNIISISIIKTSTMSKARMSIWKKKGFLWVTLLLFLVSAALHWAFGWEAYKNEQQAHNQPVVVNEYVVEMARDTAENWQSEFLQLIWQVAGLAFLLYVSSPQSKEGDDRKEEKLDYIIKMLDPKKYDEVIKQFDQKYPRE